MPTLKDWFTMIPAGEDRSAHVTLRVAAASKT